MIGTAMETYRVEQLELGRVSQLEYEENLGVSLLLHNCTFQSVTLS